MNTQDRLAHLRELIEQKAERFGATVVRSMDDAVLLELMDIISEQERRIAEVVDAADRERTRALERNEQL